MSEQDRQRVILALAQRLKGRPAEPFEPPSASTEHAVTATRLERAIYRLQAEDALAGRQEQLGKAAEIYAMSEGGKFLRDVATQTAFLRDPAGFAAREAEAAEEGQRLRDMMPDPGTEVHAVADILSGKFRS